ncbi:hypothetical protein V1264_005882 [Littorina saxatilis]|uniref:Reverse transcriptase RNase H-like domain-containing protein n=1 Tax=Littorina saxatilis TaxID=31220 RepID=A0AAN9B0Y6_9CAEN
MAYFSPDLATQVVVDAGPNCAGAVLAQCDQKDIRHIVAYASRALTDVESRYSQTVREALAVVWTCEHFHLYLYGSQFTVIFDHQRLEVIYNSPTSRTSARIER